MAKTIIVGVSSSIASFKAVQLVSDLIKMNYDVEVIMTKNACEMVTPLSFSTLTKHKTYVETFDKNVDYDIKHVSLAKKADLFIVVPATENIIAKVVHGIADDMLSTTFLACDCPKIICPAMNTKMYLNQVTQDNLNKARQYGYQIVEPVVGHLACGEMGMGKLADLSTIKDTIVNILETEKILVGKKVLISAGPTIEPLDPVRYLTNHSSGKMGYALAKAAKIMGAEVDLISGPTNLKAPLGVNVHNIKTALELEAKMNEFFEESDYVIMAAAVADYRPEVVALQKIKKDNEELTLKMVKNPDILKQLGKRKTHQKICGFAMETENILVNARQKLESKNCDMLIVNDLFEPGAGFKVDTNVVTVLTGKNQEKLPQMSKEALAKIILEKLAKL